MRRPTLIPRSFPESRSGAPPVPSRLTHQSTSRAPSAITVSPSPDRLGVQRVVAVRVEAQAPAEARLADGLAFGRSLDEVDEPAMRRLLLPSHVGERQVRFLLRHACVEGID